MTVPLPGVIADIERAAGREAALAVMAAHGGSKIYFPVPQKLERFPQRFLQNHLVRCVGYEAALRIVKEITPIGGEISIPIGAAVRRARQRQWVLDYDGKFSVAEIARRLGFTTRHVERTRQKLRSEGLIK